MSSRAIRPGQPQDAGTLLASRIRMLEQSNQQLREINQGLQTFTASATHDLRSPLYCLQLYQRRLTAVLKAHPDALSACERWLHHQQTTIDSMQQLIEGMLDLAHISHLQPNLAPLDCNQLAGTIVEQLRLQYPDHQVDIDINCGKQVQADQRLLYSLLHNLLSNAWKFTQGSPTPRVSLQRCADQPVLTFQISDNGAGFDMRYAQRLFEPFQRLHASSEFPGAGIGLATAARIVERLGGRIWAKAQPNLGATFYFTLPTAEHPQDAAAAPAASGDIRV